jgi:spore maturation protein CgeB
MKPKILVSGIAFHSYVPLIAKGAAFAGCEAVEHSFRVGHNGSIGSITTHYARRMFGTDPKNRYCDSLLNEVARHSPSILLIIKGELLSAECLRMIRQAHPGIVVALWLMDSIKRVRLDDAIHENIDIAAFFEPSDINCEDARPFRKKVYLPAAYDPSTYFPRDLDKEFQVSFCGAPYEDRLPVLEGLAAAAARYKWKIALVADFYRNVPFARCRFSKRYPLLARYMLSREMSPREVNDLYNRSIVVLNIHHSQNALGFNPRTVEILGSGACQLVDHKRSLESVFPDREAVVYYETPDEIVELMRELFADGELQAKLRRNAPEYARNHTFEARIGLLLEEIKSTGQRHSEKAS